MRLHCDIITFMTLAQLISRMQALKGKGVQGNSADRWGENRERDPHQDREEPADEGEP